MVASDTLVGLVGAGILLVALAGVFVFESKASSVNKDLALANDAVVPASGSKLTYTAGTGTPVGTSCLPNPPQTACDPQKVQLTLTVSGAPTLPGTRLKYVASLAGGQTPIVLGTLAQDGTNYKITSSPKNTGADSQRVVVTIEKTENPTTPSDLVVFSAPSGQPANRGGANVDLKTTYTPTLAQGTAKATLRDTDQGMSAQVTLTGAKNYSKMSYVYRVWLHSSTSGYTYVGNLTDSGNESTISVTVAGGRVSSYDHLFVTLEPKDANGWSSKTETGGPVLYRVRVSGQDVAPPPR